MRRNANALDEPKRDPWFNPHLYPGNARAHEVVVPVVRAVEQHGRKRALRSQDKRTLRNVLIPLVANLIVNRRWIGTPYRHPKGTPSFYVLSD